MQTISITSGSYQNREVNGTFEVVNAPRAYSASEHNNGYAKAGFWGYVRVQMEDRPRYVHLKETGFLMENRTPIASSINEEVTKADIEELDMRIRRRFQVLDIMCAGVIQGNVRGLIVSGAAGIGKTYTFERELVAAQERGEIGNLEHVKGKLTPLFLFKTLYENRNPGDVVLLDDCDSVFSDETALNILKAALDSSDERWLTYGSATKWLEENNVESKFLFEGSIIFITNLDFDSMIAADSKMSPHYSALISRSTYLDLAIHSRLEIMVRVQQIATSTNLMSTLGVGAETATQIVAFCWENYSKMREISIRTLVKIASYVRIAPDQWEMLASELTIA